MNKTYYINQNQKTNIMKTKFKTSGTSVSLMIISLCSMLLTLDNNIAFGQQSTDGVSISTDTLPPHESAMLDVRSNVKGILIPRMTTVARNNLGSIASDGLMVYDTELHAIFFWDAGVSAWKKLVAAPENSTGGVTPIRGIIMFSGNLNSAFDPTGLGKVGTDTEGWALCDGRNSTPDLRGRFVVGVTDDNLINGNDEANDDAYKTTDPRPVSIGGTPKTGGEKEVELKRDNMPDHNHLGSTVQNSDGTSDITINIINIDKSGPHKHIIVGNREGTKADRDRLRRTKGGHHKADTDFGFWTGLGPNSSTAGPDGGHTHAGGSGTGKLTPHVHPLTIAPEGNGTPHNNVPPYYALAYIMRVN